MSLPAIYSYKSKNEETNKKTNKVMMKKQHSARPIMTLALLALMLYKLIFAPAVMDAKSADKTSLATAVQHMSQTIRPVD